jgi:hypothetical protein
MLPFAICFIVCINYLEILLAILYKDYAYYEGYVTLNAPLSNLIAKYFEYDVLSVIVTLIISVAIETCKWNKLAVLYTALQLMFKIGVADMELSLTAVGIMSAINVIISAFLVYKGIRMLNIC